MAGRPTPVKVRGLTFCRIRRHGRGNVQDAFPADIERERRLAEALRANLRKRKAQTREARAHDEKPSDATKG